MKKNNIFITGASGFLGTHLVARLVRAGFSVSLFAGHTNKKLKIKKMDLTNFSEVRKQVRKYKPDVVIHMGGLVNLAREFSVAKACVDANTIGTLHLLEAIKDTKLTLFIYISTEEVYGDAPVPYEETALPRPPSPYAITKLSGEHLSTLYGKNFGFAVRIFRLGTMYGPGDSKHRFLPSVIYKALRGEEIPLNTGKKSRDYVYVDDVVDALIASLRHGRVKDTEIINIAGSKSYKLKTVVDNILKICQSTSTARYNAFPDRPLEADIWKMSIKKAKKLLSWSPKTDLVTGLTQTIEYYKTYR